MRLSWLIQVFLSHFCTTNNHSIRAVAFSSFFGQNKHNLRPRFSWQNHSFDCLYRYSVFVSQTALISNNIWYYLLSICTDIYLQAMVTEGRNPANPNKLALKRLKFIFILLTLSNAAAVSKILFTKNEILFTNITGV